MQSCSTEESNFVRLARQGSFVVLDELLHIGNLHRLVHYDSDILLCVRHRNIDFDEWFVFASIWQVQSSFESVELRMERAWIVSLRN